MQFKKIIATALLVIAASGVGANSQDFLNDPIKKAVMESYDEMLTKNPSDYAVYFRRANEYYNHNVYSKALADINQALKYAPEKEKDLRVQCFALRGAIHERLGMNNEAAEDFGNAIALDPSNYPLIYQRANIEYTMGKYAAAREDYLKMQRINTRSQEALFGLARCAVMENDRATANRLIDEAVGLTPNSADAYNHRGSVRALMGDNVDAVNDYIMALRLSRDANLSKPLRNLSEMSDVDYQAVMNGLADAIARNNRNGALYYIRAVIAQSHFRYADAVADYNTILDGNLFNTPGLYRRLSECYYALGKYEEAAFNIDYAIGSSPDNADAYVVKSDIKRAMDAPSQAIQAADRALSREKNYAPALLAKGLAEIAYKQITEGSNSIGNAALAEPAAPYYKMMRAWVLNNILGDTDNADKYYYDVINLKTYAADDLHSLRGFALLYTGNTEEADAWMEKVLKDNADAQDGEAAYYGACYYGARGDMTKALECVETALKKGYANYHNWMNNTTGRINVAPLRNEVGFTQLMNQYSYIFAVMK